MKNNFKDTIGEESERMKQMQEILSKTIGGDLASVKPEPIEEEQDPPEPEHPANEHWVLVHHWLGKSEWEKRDFDDENEEWDTPRTEFDPYKPEDKAMLNKEDIEKLEKFFNWEDKHEIAEDKYGKYDAYYKQGYWETWLRGRHLHISSPRSAWMQLAGRHYVYDLDTKEIQCISLS